MDSLNRRLGGIMPILVTPFAADGSVDETAVGAEIDFLANSGVDWVGVGFGSEVHRLTSDEGSSLTRSVKERADGRVGVVGNAEMTSVVGAIASVEAAAAAGADVALMRPFGLDGIPQETLFGAVQSVSEEAVLPVILQDAPQSTGVELSARTLARLLVEAPGVVAVKVEPPVPAPKISAIVDALDGHPGTILGGIGGLDFLSELGRGAAGTMPGPAFPEVFVEIYRRFEAGEFAEAQMLFSRILPLILIGSRSLNDFIALQKYVLHWRGVLPAGHLRSPAPEMGHHYRHEIDVLLDATGLEALLGELAGAER